MNFKKKTYLLFFIFFLVLPFFGKEFFVEKFGYYFDLPEEWDVLDSSDVSRIAFTDPDQIVVLQSIAFSGKSFKTAEEIFQDIKEKLGASGEGAHFYYYGRDSIFADLNFSTGKYDVKGYFVFINGNDIDYALFCFAPIDYYGKYHEFLLSALDSFSLNKAGKFKPGPVSQFYFPYPMEVIKEPVRMIINGKQINTSVNKEEIKATQVLVEREAKVLAKYTSSQMEAWHRNYRMIYRDNYDRLLEFTGLLEKELGLKGKSKEDLVKILLNWIQDFEYYKTGTIADMSSPLASAYTFSGDCDSRAILFVILLHQLNIDARLLVSVKYNHSAICVDGDGNGARLDFDGKSYIYAELTEKVNIGMIPQKMADPTGWTSMQFGNF